MELLYIIGYGLTGGFMLNMWFKPCKYNNNFLSIILWPISIPAAIGEAAAKKIRRKVFNNDDIMFI